MIKWTGNASRVAIKRWKWLAKLKVLTFKHNYNATEIMTFKLRNLSVLFFCNILSSRFWRQNVRECSLRLAHRSLFFLPSLPSVTPAASVCLCASASDNVSSLPWLEAEVTPPNVSPSIRWGLSSGPRPRWQRRDRSWMRVVCPRGSQSLPQRPAGQRRE